MAYGLKLVSPWGFTVLDENYRYLNNTLSGITTIPAGSTAGTLSPFIPLSDADDPDKHLIMASSLFGPSFYEPVVSSSGFRFRLLIDTPDALVIDYLVVRHG